LLNLAHAYHLHIEFFVNILDCVLNLAELAEH
jgi:hypothetical protein